MSIHIGSVTYLIAAFANALAVLSLAGRQWAIVIWTGWVAVALTGNWLLAVWYNRR